MKGFGEKHQISNKKKSNIDLKNIKEQIIKQALAHHSKGNIQEAKKYLFCSAWSVLETKCTIFVVSGSSLIQTKVSKKCHGSDLTKKCRSPY